MTDNPFEKLFDSLDENLVNQNKDEAELLKILMTVTQSYRDKLKADKIKLTVEDAKAALDGLFTHLNGEKFPADLTKTQKVLAHLYIEQLFLFKMK